jgi:DNA ligase-associated metallophosphoesterase
MYATTLLRYREDDDFDNASARILLCGKAFQADPTGALYWPAENTLIVADLQLSKCSYLEDDDVLMPPYDTASAFQKLEEALDRYDPVRVIALGNSFAGLSSQAMSPHQLDWIQDMMEGREWYWVMSQDASLKPDSLPGIVVPQMMLGGIKFRAEPLRAPVANEIAGALHPVAQISEYGHAMRGRCFVSNGMRMVLPSMGNYSAGLNVLEEAFDPLLGRNGLFVWLISNDRVYAVASGLLLEDKAA